MMLDASLATLHFDNRYLSLTWRSATGTESVERIELDALEPKQRKAVLRAVDKAMNGTGKLEGLKLDRKAACPVKAVVDLYHERLPMLPRVAVLTSARETQIRGLWVKELPTLETWGNYFDHVRASAFLTGKAKPAPGRAVFLADLEWLTKPANFAKVAEGKYHRAELDR